MRRGFISLVLFLAGLSLFLYPLVANYINNYVYKTRVIRYEKVVDNLKVEDVNEKFQKMETYNSLLGRAAFKMNDPFVQDAEVNKESLNFINKDEIFGTVSIPKINEELPIYLGASQENLSKGIGQIEGTSLPIGGKDTHAVLAGHRGYHGAKMFRHLDWLTDGDLFYVKVFGKQQEYKVVGREIINPNQVDKLNVIKGKDKVTLLTCEPYTSSKYRLLVYGERVEAEQNEIERQSKSIADVRSHETRDLFEKLFFGIVGLIVICIGLYGLLKTKN
ncbi:class C sortase [Bacillus wiedmannii]|uniref:Class C sortase n=1 Tax=Bacillus wiedmannii TaxID=1890302 RepID=A0A2B6X364_9BACI|nr:class C sortase [Bacillus wiedmannii]KMP95396.1 sortase [Bacillus wiedmannii]MCU5707823.1 class C sortase [Bacillus wiedmannii]PEI76019.1 class C sortase [Bacillus wiedmannii]PEJ51156.1 class C sortase [Bacillus wiedmannii]PEJ76715.1 class C sortase [Bacillus wiedmannii]